MNMSPIKKIILGLAAVSIVFSIVTANNLTTVMMIMSSRKMNAGSQNDSAVVQQQNDDQQAADNSSASNDSSYTDNNTSSNDSSASNGGSTSTDSSASNGGSTSTDSSASNNGSASNNSGSSNNASNSSTPAGNSGSSNAGSSSKLSDQQVVDLYKKAVNAARTKSKSVVRVKDGAINYKGIVEAGKLSGTASSLMGMFMAKDANSIEAKNEAWEKEKLPDASALTTGGLQKISYEDKGDKYVVTLVAKNAKNPKAGGDGVGAIAGVIEESQITGAIGSVPGLTLEGISIDYENVTTVATIDKATGNLVALNLDAPCILNIGHAKVPILGEVNNAKVGIQVITEYTVAY